MSALCAPWIFCKNTGELSPKSTPDAIRFPFNCFLSSFLSGFLFSRLFGCLSLWGVPSLVFGRPVCPVHRVLSPSGVPEGALFPQCTDCGSWSGPWSLYPPFSHPPPLGGGPNPRAFNPPSQPPNVGAGYEKKSARFQCLSRHPCLVLSHASCRCSRHPPQKVGGLSDPFRASLFFDAGGDGFLGMGGKRNPPSASFPQLSVPACPGASGGGASGGRSGSVDTLRRTFSPYTPISGAAFFSRMCWRKGKHQTTVFPPFCNLSHPSFCLRRPDPYR
jgi:hypothetical protein